eukprot:4542879-Amphidinium_carterae.1
MMATCPLGQALHAGATPSSHYNPMGEAGNVEKRLHCACCPCFLLKAKGFTVPIYIIPPFSI